jgi:hypothetical protein
LAVTPNWSSLAGWTSLALSRRKVDEQGSCLSCLVPFLTTLPASTTIDIWDGIFDHLLVLRNEVSIRLHVRGRLYLPVVIRHSP